MDADTWSCPRHDTEENHSLHERKRVQGADVNTKTERYVRRHQERQSKGKMVMCNGSRMTPTGVTTLAVTNTKTGETVDVEFVVVKNYYTCLMRSTTVQEMGLITVHRGTFVAETKQSRVNETSARKTTIRDRKKTIAERR